MKIKIVSAALVLGVILLGCTASAQATPVKAPPAPTMELAYIPTVPDLELGNKANTPQEKLEKRTNEKLIEKLKQYFREKKRRKKQSIV